MIFEIITKPTSCVISIYY